LFAVVHNGIIENYRQLKDELVADGVTFISDTDTEIIPNLLAKYYSGDLLSAVQQTIRRLEGSFALGIICTRMPDTVIGVRRFSPLLVGAAKGESFISSDVTAIPSHADKLFHMDDDEIALISPRSVAFYSADGKRLVKKPSAFSAHTEAAEKGEFEHFMLKEIFEQPEALRRIIPPSAQKLDTLFASLDPLRIKALRRVELVACGSAYHAGAWGEYVLEGLTELPSKALLSSEYRYRTPVTDEHSLVIAISQSGETADTLAALRLAKEKGAYTLAIVNRENSALATEADVVLYTNAGTEIGV
jgi:glucosamine--fructose-6-phosphate aminotransferase (isomerizing)